MPLCIRAPIKTSASQFHRQERRVSRSLFLQRSHPYKGQACLPVSALSGEIWMTSPQVTCKVALAIQCPILECGTTDGATTRAPNCCARPSRVHGELNVKRLMRAGMVLRDKRVRENRREVRIGGRAELEGAWMGTTCRGISRRWIGR